MTNGHGPRKRPRAADLGQEIRKLVGEDRLDDALSLLRSETERLSSSLGDDVVLLDRRLRAIEADERRGTATREQILARRQEVAQAMLHLVREISAPLEPADSVPLRPLEARELKARTSYLRDLRAHVENLLRESIHNARFLDLGIADTPTATKLPWVYKNTSSAAEFGNIEEAFRAYHRRLLLLGEPGSGKTTTLLHLALDLIAEAEESPSAPIPLMVNLSKFRIEAPAPSLLSRLWRARAEPTSLDRSFEKWLAGELAEHPTVSFSYAQQWVREGRIAALLDGLDEVGDERRAQTAALLNETFLREHPDGVVVVCSRVAEYRPLQDQERTRLQLRGAVTLQQLSRAQIAEYLDAAHASGLREALGRDAALDELAQTPLILSIMTLAYGGLPADEIPSFALVADQRHHLLETFVSRMLQRKERRDRRIPFDDDADKDVRPEDCRYPPERTKRYLSWLAILLSVRMQTAFSMSRFESFLAAETVDQASLEVRLSRLSRSVLLFLVLLVVAVPIVPKDRGGVLGAGAVALLGAAAHLLLPGLGRWLEARDRLEDVQAGAALVLGGLGVWLLSNSLSAVFLGDLPPGLAGILALAVYFALAMMLSPGRRAWERAPVPLGGLIGLVVAAALARLVWVSGAAAMVCGIGVLAGQVAGLAMLRWRSGSFRLVHLAVVAAIPGAIGYFGVLVSVVERTLSWTLAYGWVAATLTATFQTTNATFRLVTLATLVTAGGALGGSEGSIIGAALFWLGLVGPSVSDLVWDLVLDAHPADIDDEERRRSWIARSAALLSNGVEKHVEQWILSPACRWSAVALRRLPSRWRSFLRHCGQSLLLKPFHGEVEFAHRRLRDHFALRDLIPRLRESDGDRRTDVIRALGFQGAAAIDLLAELAVTGSVEERTTAVNALGRIAAPEAFPHLERAATDPAPQVRQAAIGSLRNVPREDASRLLERVADDPDIGVRKAVIDAALGRGLEYELHSMLRRMLTNPRDVLVLLRHGALAGRDGQLAKAPPLRSAPGAGTAVRAHAAFERSATFLASHVGAIASETATPFVGVAGVGLPFAAGVALVELVSDAVPAVRVAACYWMGQTPALARVGSLVQALRGDSDATVRIAAACALGMLADPEAAGPLVNALRDPDARVRCVAAMALTKDMGSQVFEPVARASIDKDLAVRAAAATTLGRLGDKRGLEPLQRSLKDGSPVVRARAAEALGHLGDGRAVDALFRILKDSESDVRSAAAEALGELGDGRAVQALLPLLGDKVDSVREATAGALGQLGDARALDPLVGLLADKDLSARQAAVRALGQLGDRRAVDPLVRMLADDRSELVRGAAASALGQLGDGRALDPLIRLLADKEWSARDAAVRALAQLGDRRAVAPLVRLLSDDGAEVVRGAAASALGQLGDGRALDPLVRSLADKEWTTRHTAVRALGQLGDRGAVAPLVRLLADDGSEVVREAAAMALGLLADPGTTASLVRLLEDEASGVREAAAQALGRLGDAVAVEPLRQVLGDEEPEVVAAAMVALVALGAMPDAPPPSTAPISTDADTPR